MNEKNFDFVMAGVTSIIGRVNRFSLMEAIINFETHFIKSWLVRFSNFHTIIKEYKDSGYTVYLIVNTIRVHGLFTGQYYTKDYIMSDVI